MSINRRRSPSSFISSFKKKRGHRVEHQYANLIKGDVIKGTQKGDVKDLKGKLHSVKSGKKWQIFLYSKNRINSSIHLKVLLGCIESFPENSAEYFNDRVKCIEFKEKYIELHGKESAKILTNNKVSEKLGLNLYIQSKNNLKDNTKLVCNYLDNKENMKNFLNEAMFNNNEVEYLAIKDETFNNNACFKVYKNEDVVNEISKICFPTTSKAGRVPQDFNVEGQKVLICYKKNNSISKNIIEIEIRNDHVKKYRSVRFNMYSKDTLFLLKNVNHEIINQI